MTVSPSTATSAATRADTRSSTTLVSEATSLSNVRRKGVSAGTVTIRTGGGAGGSGATSLTGAGAGAASRPPARVRAVGWRPRRAPGRAGACGTGPPCRRRWRRCRRAWHRRLGRRPPRARASRAPRSRCRPPAPARRWTQGAPRVSGRRRWPAPAPERAGQDECVRVSCVFRLPTPDSRLPTPDSRLPIYLRTTSSRSSVMSSIA